MRWEGGVERLDVTALTTTDAVPKNLDETIQKEVMKSINNETENRNPWISLRIIS